MVLTITKEFQWDCAHKLNDNNLSIEENQKIFGKCNNLHGHLYRLFVTVQAFSNDDGDDILENGMVINFVKLKEIVNREVVERFDHKCLNDDPLYKNNLSTCENQVQDIWHILEPSLEIEGVMIKKIKLYETPTSCATLTK